MQYYDVQSNWRRIKRHIADPKVQKILVRNFNKYTWGRWRQKFQLGDLPTEFESADWRCDNHGPGRQPAFWDYVKHGACHWLVNFNLALAQRVEPDRPWRIVTSDRHSTTWDSKKTLFDFNFLALGVEPNEAFNLANETHLPVGEELVVFMMEYYKWDLVRRKLQEDHHKSTSSL